MPANKKHLTQSPGQRLLKITAAIIGGYGVTCALHLFMAHYFSKKDLLITMKFTAYLVWVALMILAFLSKNGWKIWGWYLLAIAVLASPFIYSLLHNLKF